MAEGIELKKLKKDLDALKRAGFVVQADIRRSHSSLHRHLSKMYLWWRAARKIDGFLDSLYDEIPRIKALKTIKYGENFRRLLFVVYGDNNGLTKNNLNTWTLALNAIHRQFDDSEELFAKDGVEKLANFIETKGGVDGLARWLKKTYGVDDDDFSAEFPPLDREELAEIEKNKNQLLLKDAYAFNKNTGFPDLPAPDILHTDSAGYSLLLVRRDKNGLQLIASLDPSNQISSFLREQYRRRFDAQHPIIRPILELVQTQCLPKHLAKLSEGMVTTGTLKGWGSQKFKALRRVLFLHDSGQFVLSPMNSETGVVSLVRPFEEIIKDASNDLVMQAIDRSRIENDCLREFEFNLYDVKRAKTIPRYAETGSASHVLSLEYRPHRIQRLAFSFWPFYESFPQPQFQLLPDPHYAFSPKWSSHVSLNWLKRVASEFLDPWLERTGKQMKRKEYQRLGLTLEQNSVSFDYGEYEQGFANSIQFDLEGSSVCSVGVVGYFAPIDLITTLRGISLLPIDGSVALDFDGHVLQLKFKTSSCGGASHEIYVPARAMDGSAASAPFCLYQPENVPDLGVSSKPNEDDCISDGLES